MTSAKELAEKIGKHKGFLGIFPSDEMPNPSFINYSFIVNYDPEKKPGSHWVAIKKEGTNLEFFDSFGRAPDDDDLILHDKTHFKKWLRDHSFHGRYTYNKFDYQSLYEDTCGMWCVMFILDPLKLSIAKLRTTRDKYVKEWFNKLKNHPYINYDSDSSLSEDSD